jgi:hypothetical protein
MTRLLTGRRGPPTNPRCGAHAETWNLTSGVSSYVDQPWVREDIRRHRALEPRRAHKRRPVDGLRGRTARPRVWTSSPLRTQRPSSRARSNRGRCSRACMIGTARLCCLAARKPPDVSKAHQSGAGDMADPHRPRGRIRARLARVVLVGQARGRPAGGRPCSRRGAFRRETPSPRPSSSSDGSTAIWCSASRTRSSARPPPPDQAHAPLTADEPRGREAVVRSATWGLRAERVEPAPRRDGARRPHPLRRCGHLRSSR